MARDADMSEVLETVTTLAQDIARLAPDCADKAMQIVDLVRSLEGQADRARVQDAIEEKLADSDLSDSQLQATTSAVVGALRQPI